MLLCVNVNKLPWFLGYFWYKRLRVLGCISHRGSVLSAVP